MKETMRIAALIWMLATGIVIGTRSAMAGPATGRADPLAATESAAARQSAIESIPLERLDEAGRAKVRSVVSNITVFRRMPVRVVGCDPNLYLFLVRHPDVMVNIWEALGISQLRLRQSGPDIFQVAETDGTVAKVEFLYKSHDLHVIFGQWSYSGPLLVRPVQGRCLAVLKSGYVQETDGRYYVTNRLDAFLSVEPGGVELLTKTLHPLVVKNADANFIQVVGFVGSLSRTAEVNSRGMQRLAAKLIHVEPEVRQELATLADRIGQKATAAETPKRTTQEPQVLARRPGEKR